MKKLIDLSHIIESGMITYKGLPAPVISDYLSRDASKDHYAGGTTFNIGKVEMVANTGTYIDAPFHRYEDGKDIANLALVKLADLEGIVFRAAVTSRAIGPDLFAADDIREKAVLIQTGWDQHWGSEQYFEGHPFLTAEAADWLKNNGAALVGIDSLNIDDTTDGNRPVHSVLLGAGIPIIEHLCNLDNLPEEGFTFHAVPARIKRIGSFPVRAFAIVKT